MCEGQLIFSGNQEKRITQNLFDAAILSVTQGSPDLSKIFEGKVTKLKFLFRFFPVTNQSLKIIYSFLQVCAVAKTIKRKKHQNSEGRVIKLPGGK